MPKRFKSFDNSVPGPLVGGAVAAMARHTPHTCLSSTCGAEHATHTPFANVQKFTDKLRYWL
jgi:hypothetical protein